MQSYFKPVFSKVLVLYEKNANFQLKVTKNYVCNVQKNCDMAEIRMEVWFITNRKLIIISDL